MSLRIGVLGASRIAEAAIVGPAAELGHRLVAVAARDRSRAQVFANEYGVERVLGDYQAVIDDPEVDVVYNPLANALHAPWNLAAIAAGKPVLSEKPFARNEFDARRVAEAAAAAGVSVLEGFHYFFHPVTQRAFELAGDGTVGTVTHVEVRMAMPMPMPMPGDGDPRWSLDLAGGALMDLGCYGMHVMRSLGRLAVPGIEGRPAIVRAHAEQRTPGVDAWCDVELGGEHRRTIQHEGVVYPSVGGLRRTRRTRDTVALRHRRRSGEHGLRGCGLPRGRHATPLGPEVRAADGRAWWMAGWRSARAIAAVAA